MEKLLISIAIALTLAWVASAYRQQITFYDTESDSELSNFCGFQNHVPDTANFTHCLSKAKRICWRGYWALFNDENYDRHYFAWDGDQCRNFSTLYQVKSFRYGGASESEEHGISLFSKSEYGGETLFVNSTAFIGNTMDVVSIIYNAKSSWLLFEGQAFDGKSYCLPSSNSRDYIEVASIKYISNMTSVGSGSRDC